MNTRELEDLFYGPVEPGVIPKGGGKKPFGFMYRRVVLWWEYQQRALEQWEREILSDPEKYGRQLPRGLRRRIRDAGKKAEEEEARRIYGNLRLDETSGSRS